ncbi:uncharacterized protein LOC123502570 [Portunus trituberculatus]|uniref:uncharacterized protein LOC123502570 n=1 Tax=Portunus trituberculatus TaxID=210409 RepID=UPI001E1D02AF|nr:uncharacterized protein LOC123502570 [Portunus trituberculatus]
MGNACHGKAKGTDDYDLPPPNIITTFGLDGDPTDHKEPSAVIQWEKRQQELNQEVMEKMREEFHNRPDNFILNLLISSVQFYSNYNREKAEIRNHIRDREIAFDRKLEASKRKVLYMGGHEEISGTHVLYQPREHPYMEVPTPLQFFLVHDNIDLYPETQYEELQERQYTDLDGPGYRFCTEYSNRHPGYVRLRCVDIIPGVTRSNTYEDIYGFLKPVDESERDPVVDPRPLRRASLTSQTPNGQLPNGALPNGRHSLYSDFEESDDEEAHRRSPPTSPESPVSNPLPAQLKARRPSGVLPHSYPESGQLSQLITAMRAVANGENKSLPNGDVGHAAPRRRSLSERRPSGVFPRVGPEMRRLRLTSAQTDTTDSRALLARRLTLVEEEEEDEEEYEIRENGDTSSSSSDTGPAGLEPGEVLEEVEEEEVVMRSTGHPVKQETILHARLNEGCFINRNIKIKDPSDAYGISTKTERRTYFSSERHMECFEDDFEDVAKVLGKEHLLDTSQRQGPAVLASELMIEEIGPKFHVEFIPTLLLKEWPQCAFEWRMRERRGKLDPEAKVMYRWPKEINVQEALQAGCNLVPIGHYNPKEPNRVMKIEWQIQFIKAEQILLRSLGHVQMRLLLWVEYLLRDHLEDVPCLQNQHLRYILFWMCEKNFRDWQEPRLGIKLKAYLKTLYNSLSMESLPHYFVMSSNMMKSIPEKYIRQAQATVKKIKENLPIYVMHTMNRMRYASDFYPRLNVRKVFKLVTMESFGLEHINPTLLQLAAEENNKEEENDKALRSDSEDDDGDAEEKRKLHEMRRKRKEQVEAQIAKRNSINNTKKRPSTIRLDSKVKRVKDLRAGPVLRLFAKHFLAMARASNRNRAYPQAYMYLLLTGNMATLLDETGNNEDAVSLRRQVEQLNVASRGGVRDMLSSSWSVNEQHDLVPSTAPPRGSNWELNTPPPQPPPERNSVFGMDRLHTAPALQNIDPQKHSIATRTLSNTDSDMDIIELPSDSPASTLPNSPLTPPADPAPLPVELPTPPTSPRTDSPELMTLEHPSHTGSDVPDTLISPTSPSPEPNFLSLREEDTDEDDESTDL